MRGIGFFLGTLVLAGSSLVRAGEVLTIADRLAQQHLPYIYGSADLSAGGLDCSGFTQMVYRQACGIELPNEADLQLDYCRKHGQVWDSTSDWTPATLRPGDLVFFAGPYDLPRASRVTHVMIYCGRNIMVGSQGEGWQLNGAHGGVGYYELPDRYPTGILGESGERFIGHRRVFAYARVTGATGGTLNPAIALRHAAEVNGKVAMTAHID